MYLRGTVWEYHFEPGTAPDPAVIVSNNGRNRSAWPLVHVVRVTTSPREPHPTIVELPDGEPVDGRVICDDLAPVAKAALGRRLGGLSPQVMQRVDAALKIVLDLH